ncbi:MAG: DUF2764 family protein [Candidatus Marinimicrobia bacterium]|nr:DUF2764 family protein [Candidatus Neomarinimicrobiota bacterium]
MDKYYYIAAQLPFLQLNSNTDFNQKKFFYEMEKWLSDQELRQLEEADISRTKPQSSDSGIVTQYQEFETSLRQELAVWRKARKEGYEHKTTLLPQNLLKEGNPLEIEKKLLQFRWDYLDDLGLDHYFDWEFLVLYNYKLQLLERFRSFDKEKGLDKFKQYTEVGL